MQDHKNKIEAILFTTGKFLTLAEISSLSEIGSLGHIKQMLSELKEDYSNRETALEIINDEKNRMDFNDHFRQKKIDGN